MYSDEASDLSVSVTPGNGQLTVSFPKKTIDDEIPDTFEMVVQKTTGDTAAAPIVLSASSYKTDTITYTINKLTNNTRYSVAVSAIKGKTLIAVGSGFGTPVAPTPKLSPAPKLSAVKAAAGNGLVTISFNKLPGTNTAYYHIDYWTVKNGKKSPIVPIVIKAQTVKKNSHSFVVKKLKNGTTYYFNVYAKKIDKSSTLAVQVKATPSAPKAKK